MRWGLDGDIILYSVAFAAKDDPIAFACRSARSVCEQIMQELRAEGVEIYLTGDGNYRHEYACDTYPYKGNRKSDKPQHFTALKEYMIDSLGAVVVEGEEADDKLGYMACQHGHGIATLDKDLYGVPGWHWNWRRRELFHASPEDADRFFYKQLITGDATDNIPGLFKRLGQKATRKLLDPIEDMYDPAEMYAYVRNVYAEAFDKVGMCVDEKEQILDDWLLRQGRQLWIRRQEGELWAFPLGA